MNTEATKPVFLTKYTWSLRKVGGDWLGAARLYIKTFLHGGDSITWGSHDQTLNITPWQLEELATEVAISAKNELLAALEQGFNNTNPGPLRDIPEWLNRVRELRRDIRKPLCQVGASAEYATTKEPDSLQRTLAVEIFKTESAKLMMNHGEAIVTALALGDYCDEAK